MIRTLLLFLLAVPLLAQNAFYLDLAGDWRTRVGDDPAWADPAFDDAGWEKLRLPAAAGSFSGEFRWLRRTFELPVGAKTEDLVVTIGGHRRRYEVFVNGVRVGSADSNYPRATLFSLAPGAVRPGARNVIALRAIKTPPAFAALGTMANAGPWLLTSRINAPLGAPAADRLERLTLATPVIAAALLYFVYATLLILLWFGDRKQWTLLGIGLFLMNEVALRFGEYKAVFSDSSGTTFLGLGLAALLFAVFHQFGKRGPGVHALAAVPLYFAVTQIRHEDSRDFQVLFLYGIVALESWWLIRGWAAYRGKRMTLITLMAITLLWTTRVPSSLQLPQPAIEVWGYFVRSFDSAVVVLTLALIVLLVRRLLDDRREKQRLVGEFEAARAVQQLLLPATSVASATFSLAAVYEPAQEVGGDFHWTRLDPDGSLVVVVGDVSGKGLKAAMLVSVAIGFLRNEKSASPAAILGALNGGVVGQTGGGFVTCCCARFTMDGTTVLANAGHPSPYRSGSEVQLDAGLPLGITAGVEYAETIIRGDQLTFVSDGVIEAANARGELFGFERTQSVSEGSAREIAEAARAWGQNDDITVVTVGRAA
jgi:sigma-B regulation protein RsbU (phosphoserine phosphatase)